MRLSMLLLTTALLITTTAHAALASPPSVTERTPPPHKKSPARARNYAIGGALLGSALFGGGALVSGGAGHHAASTAALVGGSLALVVGPSAGHWYAGKPVTTGMVLRAVGVGAAILSANKAAECLAEACGDNVGELAGTVLVTGLGLVVVGTVWDLVTADDEAAAWNRRHGLDVDVAPTVIGTAHGLAPGLARAGRFRVSRRRPTSSRARPRRPGPRPARGT
jgi:hypothetical protein